MKCEVWQEGSGKYTEKLEENGRAATEEEGLP
jgi:hypothetical protein